MKPPPTGWRASPAVTWLATYLATAGCAASIPAGSIPRPPLLETSPDRGQSLSLAGLSSPVGRVLSNPPYPSPGDARGPMTFEALVSLTLTENPDRGLSSARIEQARANLDGARAAWWPTVQLNLSYLRADAPSMFLFKTIDAGRFQPGTNFNRPGSFDNWEAGVQAQFNLYNGGRDALVKALALDAVESAQLQAGGLEDSLVAAVTDGWYSVRAAEEQMRTAQNSIEMVGSQLSAAKARFDNGSGLRTDVLSLQVRLLQSREDLLRATNGRDLGLAALAQLAGIEDVRKFQLVGDGSKAKPTVKDLDQALRQAEEHRAELAIAKHRVSQAERSLELSRSSYLPRADAFAQGWRDGPDFGFDESRDNWALGVSLSWSLFDGKRGAGVDEARAQLVETRQALRKVLLSVQYDVRSAWLRVTETQARLEVSQQAAATAAQSLELVRAQYESGAALITRYLEAELATTQARARWTSARYGVARAQADLARALGSHLELTDREDE